jgi:hypothetical protein
MSFGYSGEGRGAEGSAATSALWSAAWEGLRAGFAGARGGAEGSVTSSALWSAAWLRLRAGFIGAGGGAKLVGTGAGGSAGVTAPACPLDAMGRGLSRARTGSATTRAGTRTERPAAAKALA